MRDAHEDLANSFSVSAEQARAGILQARLDNCGSDQRCQRQAYEDARDPFQVGVTDTLGTAAASLMVGGACIATFGAVCGIALLYLGATSAVDTVSTEFTNHGVDIAGGHLGGTEPWTDYERGQYETSLTLFVVGGIGAKKFGGFGRNPGRPTNSVGMEYPGVVDPRTGSEIPFPGQGMKQVAPALRSPWGKGIQRYQYRKSWIEQGFKEPEGGWPKYDLHHIRPREFGGDNSFENIVPVLRDVHQNQFNVWWRDYAHD
jgi:hypothetical protein